MNANHGLQICDHMCSLALIFFLYHVYQQNWKGTIDISHEGKLVN